jgi:hypothetical protein
MAGYQLILVFGITDLPCFLVFSYLFHLLLKNASNFIIANKPPPFADSGLLLDQGGERGPTKSRSLSTLWISRGGHSDGWGGCVLSLFLAIFYPFPKENKIKC